MNILVKKTVCEAVSKSSKLLSLDQIWMFRCDFCQRFKGTQAFRNEIA